jgi:hypothetical protein
MFLLNRHRILTSQSLLKVRMVCNR